MTQSKTLRRWELALLLGVALAALFALTGVVVTGVWNETYARIEF